MSDAFWAKGRIFLTELELVIQKSDNEIHLLDAQLTAKQEQLHEVSQRLQSCLQRGVALDSADSS